MPQSSQNQQVTAKGVMSQIHALAGGAGPLPGSGGLDVKSVLQGLTDFFGAKKDMPAEGEASGSTTATGDSGSQGDMQTPLASPAASSTPAASPPGDKAQVGNATSGVVSQGGVAAKAADAGDVSKSDGLIMTLVKMFAGGK